MVSIKVGPDIASSVYGVGSLKLNWVFWQNVLRHALVV